MYVYLLVYNFFISYFIFFFFYFVLIKFIYLHLLFNFYFHSWHAKSYVRYVILYFQRYFKVSKAFCKSVHTP